MKITSFSIRQNYPIPESSSYTEFASSPKTLHVPSKVKRAWIMNTIFTSPGPEETPGYKDQRPYKWYLSGTPIDTSPADFAGSISTIKRTSWSERESPFHFCRVSVLLRWGKLFMNYLNAKEWSSQSINEWEEHLAEAKAEFPLTLTRFLIRRTDNSQL